MSFTALDGGILENVTDIVLRADLNDSLTSGEGILKNVTDIIIRTDLNDSLASGNGKNASDSGTVWTDAWLYHTLIPWMAAVSLVSNLIVVVSCAMILRKGNYRKTTYIFLANLALTDLVTSASTISQHLFPQVFYDLQICYLHIGMKVSSCVASCISVGLIAIDRYIYILHGLYYQKWINTKRVYISILLAWTVAIIIGFLPLVGWYRNKLKDRKCWYTILAPKAVICMTLTVTTIPIITVSVLYTIISYRAIKNVYRLNATTEFERNRNELRMFRGSSVNIKDLPNPQVDKKPNKWKAIKLVLFTSGCFLFTWEPYIAVSFIYVFTENKVLAEKLSVLLQSPLLIMGFSNTLINPIIYAWWHKGFRDFVRNSIKTVRWKKNAVAPLNRKVSKPTSSVETIFEQMVA